MDAANTNTNSDADRKRAIGIRLRRIEGQVAGLHRMIDADEAASAVLTQLAAVQGALARVGQEVLASAVRLTVSESQAVDQDAANAKIDDLITLIDRYGRVAGR